MLSHSLWASLVTQLVKNPPAIEETPVQFLGPEVPLEETGYKLQYSWTSLVAQMVKNLPAIRETRVQSLCWEDPLEEGMATPPQCSCLENLHRHRRLAGRLQFVGSLRVGHDWVAQHSTAQHTLVTIISSPGMGDTGGLPSSYTLSFYILILHGGGGTFSYLSFATMKQN